MIHQLNVKMIKFLIMKLFLKDPKKFWKIIRLKKRLKIDF